MKAQEATSSKPFQRFIIGMGTADVMDTYLSPYSYNQNDARIDFILEKIWPKTSSSGWGIHLSTMENHARNVNTYDLGTYVQFAHHCFQWHQAGFHIKAGPMGYFNAGVIYNERNGNNPVQAKLSLMADVSVRTYYDFHLWKKNFQIEYSIDIPIIGLAYSPQFGQSYYEQFVLSNYDHNCVIAHCINTPTLRHRVLLQLPFWKQQWYVGYNGIIEQSKYNHLRYHSYTHSLLIGMKL